MLFSTANDNTKASLWQIRSLSPTAVFIGIVLCMVRQVASSWMFEATPYGVLQRRQTLAGSVFWSNQEAGNAVFSFLVFRGPSSLHCHKQFVCYTMCTMRTYFCQSSRNSQTKIIVAIFLGQPWQVPYLLCQR